MSTTTVTLLNKHYNINAEDDDIAMLQESAKLFNSYLNAIKESSNTISADRVALMAGLNLTREFVAYKQREEPSKNIQETLQRLNNKMTKEMESITPEIISQQNNPLPL